MGEDMKSMLIAAFAALSLEATAQTVTETTKDAPRKKAEAKKTVAKKRAAPAKPVAPRKPAVAKAPTAPRKGKVYTNDPKAPVLRDKEGNAIPTDPKAYDVSSAVGKK